MLNTSTKELSRAACLMEWPVSCAFISDALERFARWNRVFGMLAAVRLASSVSEKAAMISRKMTGDRLSPWRTPTDWVMSDFSFPIFRLTTRFVYRRSMALQNFGGPPNFLIMLMMRLWLEVSKALTRSAKITYVSRLCWRRR